MKLAGTVKKVEPFGAFVDVGVGRDGLVHVSAVSKSRVENLNDVLQAGQEVSVWVRRVDSKAGRIDLSMVEPAAVAWRDLQPGRLLTGKVVRVEKFGAFVDVGAERAGLVHVRELARHVGDDPSESLRVGDEVDVKVISVDAGKRQIDLALSAVDVAQATQETEPPPPTAMELALRKAMQTETGQGNRTSASSHKGSAGGRGEQDDILSRTLRSMPAGRKAPEA